MHHITDCTHDPLTPEAPNDDGLFEQGSAAKTSKRPGVAHRGKHIAFFYAGRLNPHRGPE